MTYKKNSERLEELEAKVDRLSATIEELDVLIEPLREQAEIKAAEERSKAERIKITSRPRPTPAQARREGVERMKEWGLGDHYRPATGRPKQAS